MNVRAEVVRTIVQDEGSALSEDEIKNAVDADGSSIDSALRSLQKSGVIDSHGLVGQSFWSLSADATPEQVKQAIEGTTVSEIAADLMQGSSLFGSPDESDARASGFDGLL